MKNKKLNRIFAGGLLSVAAAVFLSAAVPAYGAGSTQSGSSDVISVSEQSELSEETSTGNQEQDPTVSDPAAAPDDASVTATPTPENSAVPDVQDLTPTPENSGDSADPSVQSLTPTETPDASNVVQTMDWTPGWNLVNGKYYYYLDDGTMVRDQWLQDGNDWYYMNADGTMKSAEWFQDGVDWYYFRDWGGMLHDQFYTYEGNLYYFRSWGGMMYDMAFQVNGKQYKANSDGTLVTGWSEENGKYYYYNSDGSLYEKEGWLQLGDTYDSYYYISADGSRVQGQWLKVGSDWYYMNDDGTMKSEEWFQDGIDWYYFRDWGGMLHDQFFTYNGDLYYFRNWGGMMYGGPFQVNGKWYVADSNGVIFTDGWTSVNGKYYYYQEDGALYTKEGWLKLGDKYYYISADGSRVQGQWLKDGSDWYYMNDDGTMKSAEWFQDGVDWYYLRDWGGMLHDQFFDYRGNRYYFRDWGGMMYDMKFQVSGKTYKANSDGTLAKGWVQEGDKYYYYDDQYVLYQKQGWLQLGSTYDSYYYINADGSRVQDQWVKDGNDLYYMNTDGTMKSNEWYQEGNDWYYFRNWGAALHDTLFNDGENIYYFESDCKMARGWYQIGGYTYYFRDWGGAMNMACVIDGVSYVFDSNGHLVEKEIDAEVGVRTIKNFLKNALLPVGNTLYIWAGGHDDADASRYGVNPQWKSFFDSQDETYNYTEHRYEYGNGLDCSGYVGWAVHQVMEEWSTTTSTVTPQYYYEKGWGSYVEGDTSMKFRTGDVVSMSGHVWIILGQCEDGSAVILHASPQYVQISGTVSASGSTNSEAVQLAERYMRKYYPIAYSRYGCKIASKSYMTGVNHFTWSSSVLSDPDGYKNMSPAQILADLFGE